MKRTLFCLAALAVLLAGCLGAPTAVPTPTLAPPPTPTVPYQVLGSTENTSMVLVSPEDALNREGLERLGKYLCREVWSRCFVYIWDDASLADSSFPVDPAAEAALAARFIQDYTGDVTLTVYALGDE